jgi:hypothetical protein
MFRFVGHLPETQRSAHNTSAGQFIDGLGQLPSLSLAPVPSDEQLGAVFLRIFGAAPLTLLQAVDPLRFVLTVARQSVPKWTTSLLSVFTSRESHCDADEPATDPCGASCQVGATCTVHVSFVYGRCP